MLLARTHEAYQIDNTDSGANHISLLGKLRQSKAAGSNTTSSERPADADLPMSTEAHHTKRLWSQWPDCCDKSGLQTYGNQQMSNVSSSSNLVKIGSQTQNVSEETIASIKLVAPGSFQHELRHLLMLTKKLMWTNLGSLRGSYMDVYDSVQMTPRRWHRGKV